MSRFAQVPECIFDDKRLKPRHFKVLVALYMHADKHTGECHPKRNALSQMTGTREQEISLVTSELVEFGWLEKFGNGGKSCPCSYRMLVDKEGSGNPTQNADGSKSDKSQKNSKKSVKNDKNDTQNADGMKCNNTQFADGYEANPTQNAYPNPTQFAEGQITDQLTESIYLSTTGEAEVDDAKKTEKTPKPKKGNKPTTIKPDWKPSEDCIARLEMHGISAEFARGLVDEFVIYWSESGETKKSWNSTFFNKVKFEHSRPKYPVNGSKPARKPKPDNFEAVSYGEGGLI